MPRSLKQIEARTRYSHPVPGRIEIKCFVPCFDLIERFGILVIAPLLESLQSRHIDASALSRGKKLRIPVKATPYLVDEIADDRRFSSTWASKDSQYLARV